jgi:hypothetical protein
MGAFFNGQASKALIALGSAVTTLLTTLYGTAKWEPTAIAFIGFVLTYLVPNAPKSGPPNRM